MATNARCGGGSLVCVVFVCIGDLYVCCVCFMIAQFGGRAQPVNARLRPQQNASASHHFVFVTPPKPPSPPSSAASLHASSEHQQLLIGRCGLLRLLLMRIMRIVHRHVPAGGRMRRLHLLAALLASALLAPQLVAVLPRGQRWSGHSVVAKHD